MVSEDEYDLYISKDTNSEFYSQWFYFSVENTLKDHEVRFNILNYSKPTNLFKNGMKPVAFSLCEFAENNRGWNYDIADIEFTNTCIDNMSPTERQGYYNALGRCAEGDEAKGFYTLSFTYKFKYSKDKVYIALMKPYSFSRLYTYIYELESVLRIKEKDYLGDDIEPKRIQTHAKKGKKRKKCFRSQRIFKFENDRFVYTRDLLCYTNLGLPIDIITINSREKASGKKVILITARVHASEIPGSLKMQQILKSLLSDSPQAADLLKYFTIIIVPMLNPDGVVIGNTRTCFEGCDLNRCWSAPVKSVHVSIYFLKKILKQIYKRNKEIFLFCDLHGHGKLPNSFIYACNRSADGDFSSWSKIRLLPKILSKHSPFFSYNNCQFKIEAEKKDTGRVVIWKEFGVMNSFTFETSIFGYTDGGEFIPFKEADVISIGEAFVKALYEYSKIMRELGKDANLSKAYNFFYDQVDKAPKDERFPIIEIKEKKMIGISAKCTIKNDNKDDAKIARSNESYSPAQTTTPFRIDTEKCKALDDELLDAVIDMSEACEFRQKNSTLKEESPTMFKKSTVHTKVMKFGGGLATLRPRNEVRSSTRIGNSKDSRECTSREFFLPTKFPESKPLQNAIQKIREESIKRQTSLSPDEIFPIKNLMKLDAHSRNKCEEFIVYKIAPHISIRINRLDMNLGIKPVVFSEASDKFKISKKIRESPQPILNQYSHNPGILSEDIRIVEPPKSRESSITQRFLRHSAKYSQGQDCSDLIRKRGHSLRKIIQ